MQPFDSIDRLEDAAVLDRFTAPVREGVRRWLRPQALRDTLHGVWMGHPLHPALVQLPVGAFASVAVLDAVPGTERAARALIATGIVSAVPAAAAGLADWSEMHEQQQRVGLVHAALNAAGLTLYAASLASRRAGHSGKGKALAYGGISALLASASLGGHLSYRQAGGANHAEEVPHLVDAGWQDLCAVDDLATDGSPQQRMLGTVALVVVQQDGQIDVLSDRCAHLSGPLHEGTVSEDGTCITCPWHGSTFRLEDGSVVHGPATAPQHAFDVRVREGRVQVRLPGAG
jgi:nitrite reductase/ring-hydroxylating ferredoxin subunit